MEKRIEFINSKGNTLVGVLSGDVENTSLPVIVLCHGSQSSRNSSTAIDLAKMLNEKNILAFRFDFYGHGESAGKFEDLTTAELVDDVLSAISLLKQEGFNRIGLAGFSMGGGASILAAAKTNDIFLLALKSPVIDFKELELYRQKDQDSHKKELKYGWNRDSIDFNGYAALANIKVPIFIVHGTNDDQVPTNFTKEAVRQFPQIKLHLVEGADHQYSNPEHFNEMLQSMSKFITDQCS